MSDINLESYVGSISIIGLSGKFPGANNVQQFWENLINEVESIKFFDQENFETKLANNAKVSASGFLDDIELFDANFFGYSPREAEVMDPQQRLVLEYAVSALECAGYTSDKFNGHIGVYLGAALSSYLLFNLLPAKDLLDSLGAIHVSNGNDSISTPVSYKLNLTGPSIDINTACSTSLVAVHQACRSLLNYECDIALAGGVSINVLQSEGYIYQEGSIFSPDGHCRPFDENAKGTVEGCGLGIVVLKRLEDALNDRDTIYAIVRSSAVNNDGGAKVGYTAPSVQGQAEVIAEALEIANVAPDSISYVEAHGTGTALGDPIEIAALTQAFQSVNISPQEKYCAIGSVKSNVGHLNTAAGVTGLIKTILALRNKKIPATLHFQKSNPKIDFENSPFFVNSTSIDWVKRDNPRRAGVSSFGIGGTNAHLILEEAPVHDYIDSNRDFHLITLSAKTEKSLIMYQKNIADYLRTNTDAQLADIAYTLQNGREEYSYRSFIVTNSHMDASLKFASENNQYPFTSKITENRNQVIFMFPGQGSQYTNMALELYTSEPVFKDCVDYCCRKLKINMGLDLLPVLFPSLEKSQDAVSLINQTCLTQPALFVIEYSLARLLQSFDIKPQAMIGHSIGEYVAATIAGVFKLDDALSVVYHRSKLMQSVPKGTMMMVELPEHELSKLLDVDSSIAAVNAENLCVISGTCDSVSLLKAKLSDMNVQIKELHTSHAFHSKMMDPILEKFAECLSQVKFDVPQIPFISDLTGSWIKDSEATDINYWVKHLRNTVRFHDGIKILLANSDSDYTLLEVGPGKALSILAMQNVAHKVTVINTLPSLKENISSEAALLEALGKLWLNGVAINWRGFYKDEPRSRIPLPTYPFIHEYFWIDRAEHTQHTNRNYNELVVTNVKNPMDEWIYTKSWKKSFIFPISENDLIDNKYWIIFVDEANLDLISDCISLLKDICIVASGSKFNKIDSKFYQINPKNLDDYKLLLSEIIINTSKQVNIIYMWDFNTVNSYNKMPISDFFRCLLYLSKAVIQCLSSSQIKIGVVANKTYKVLNDDEVIPENIVLQGITQSLCQEYPNIRCSTIDIFIKPLQSKKFLINILSEFQYGFKDAVVAYRDTQRFVQSFEQISIDGYLKQKTSLLRKDGVYIITGGLGNIGMILAEEIVSKYKTKIVLIGRSSFPQENEWSKWLENHAPDDIISKKILKLKSIKEKSDGLMIFQVDVSNLEQMEQVFCIVEQYYGNIDGLIHAAGELRSDTFNLIDSMSDTDCEQQFHSKIYGLKTLETLLQKRNLDFCCLFSSISAVLGGLSYAAYSSANLFMDSFAQSKNFYINATPLFVINWDAWYHGEEKVDQLSSIIGNTRAFDKAILPNEGIKVFANILQLGIAEQYIVSTTDLSTRINEWVSQNKNAVDSNDLNVTSVLNNLHYRPNLATLYVKPRDQVEQKIVEIWETLIGVTGIGINDNFFELGGHSLLATRVISKIREIYEIDLSLQILFENPTVAGVAEEIVKAKINDIDEDSLKQIIADIQA